ncbi:MAG TPA: cytochrome b/b6 domain-containing protein [Acidobacteriaceae bacterium]|nr:cytochrome b/b6 domain-containing protein [Acidobacteriaceae bacterium]
MKHTQRTSSEAWKQPAPGQVRVYVWEWPVRFAHWAMVFAIVSLSITGYYMHAPYVAAHGRTAYVMGTMRFVHILSGFVLLLAIAVRLVWFFLGNRWSKWDQFVPTTKDRVQKLVAVAKYYGFMAWSPIRFIGHNPLAGASYLVIYAICGFEVLSGFALYSLTVHSPVLTFLVGWLPRLIDIQWLREFHFLFMFVFWAFFIHHIYTAILVSIEEENGLMDSIFSGYKFVPAAELEEEGVPVDDVTHA